MKTISTNLYTILELKEQFPEGYKKALQNYTKENEYAFLSCDMQYYLEVLLKENKITSISGLKLYYSLTCSQGDGAMFVGVFDWKDYTITIKHSGHYYHEKSADFSFENNNEETRYNDNDEFITLYEKICEELERYGYDLIDTSNSEENIVEECIAGDYYFDENGEMNNG